MRESLQIMLNGLLAQLPSFIALGLVYMCLLEHQGIYAAIRQKKLTPLYPLGKRSLYLILGLAVGLCSFAIINTILVVLTPEGVPAPEALDGPGFWTHLKYLTNYTGVFGVTGMVFTSITLILSAGGRWMVNLAKLLATLTILFVVLGVFIRFVG